VFPAAEHGYGIDQAELARFRALRNGHATAATPLTRSGA
jgi:hypothetical protein